MSSLLNAAFVAGGTLNATLQIHDEDRSDLWQPRFNYTYHQRNAISDALKVPWLDIWPQAKLSSGDSTVALALFGQDSNESGRFEYQPTISRGVVRPSFIRGTVTDAVGTPVGGANVQGFLTASDLYVGEIGTASNGTYELPTQYAGQAHYLVAYNPGNNTAGTTVNTLNPAL